MYEGMQCMSDNHTLVFSKPLDVFFFYLYIHLAYLDSRGSE